MEQVAEGIHRLGARLVNWYLVQDGGKVTVIDAGNPRQYGQLPAALSELGKSINDIDAVLLTHAHADHLGDSARIKSESGAAVWCHEADEDLAHGDAHREFERHWARDLGHLAAWKSLLFFVGGGALKPIPVSQVSTFADGETLDVPGRPRIIHTPGHTDGSSSILISDRGVVFTGDALVTLSIANGVTGPRIMPGSFNKDSRLSLESVDRLAGLGVMRMLPGHGEPWQGDLGDAVRAARSVGAN